LRRMTMSVVTSVLAFFLKASFGRRIAPTKSAWRGGAGSAAGELLEFPQLPRLATMRIPGRAHGGASLQRMGNELKGARTKG
jgi:hypothetical protein